MEKRYAKRIIDFLLAHPGFTVVYALIAGLLLWMTLVEPNLLKIREYRFDSPAWPAALSPLRIAVVSDLHAGVDWGENGRLDALADAVSRENPDLIFLLGDYVNYRGGVDGNLPMADFTKFLSRLRSRYGVYGVLGNHEMWYGSAPVRRAFAEAGAVLLENGNVTVELPGGPLTVAGLGERDTGSPDFPKTLKGAAPGAPVLLMTHNPKVFKNVKPEGVILSFAGHTHGGQARLPGETAAGWTLFSGGYRPGLYRYDQGGDLLLTSGIGGNPVRIRLNCPPEIAVVTIFGTAGQSVPATVTK